MWNFPQGYSKGKFKIPMTVTKYSPIKHHKPEIVPHLRHVFIKYKAWLQKWSAWPLLHHSWQTCSRSGTGSAGSFHLSLVSPVTQLLLENASLPKKCQELFKVGAPYFIWGTNCMPHLSIFKQEWSERQSLEHKY